MYSLENKISILPEEPGLVEDLNGWVIYKARPGHRFNLPKGKYHINFPFKSMPPMPYPEQMKDLPEFEKDGNKDIKSVEFRPNVVGMAWIQAEKGRIVLDSSLNEGPKFFRDFVFLHECGHFYYKTEWKCDFFATKAMIEMGWNPSQVSLCRDLLRNKKRKERITNTLDIWRV